MPFWTVLQLILLRKSEKKEAVDIQWTLYADEELFSAKDFVSVSGTTFEGEILALKAFHDLNIHTLLKELSFTPLQIKLATCQIIGRSLKNLAVRCKLAPQTTPPWPSQGEKFWGRKKLGRGPEIIGLFDNISEMG